MNHSQLEGNRGEGRSLSLKRPSNNCGLYISIYTILTLSKIHFSLGTATKSEGDRAGGAEGHSPASRGKSPVLMAVQGCLSEHHPCFLCLFIWRCKREPCSVQNTVLLNERKEKRVSRESLDEPH